MKKIVLAFLFILALNKLFAQGTCAGVHFTPIGQYPVALGSSYNFTSFINGSGDFDGDGKQDLVFIGSSIGGGYNLRNILLQRNIRTGVLPSQVSFDTSTSVFQYKGNMEFVVNDFNNDGKPDIAVAYGTAGLDSIIILVNKSTSGSFSFYVSTPYPISPDETSGGEYSVSSLKTDDYDHDGKQDIMYVGATDKKIYVMLNTGYTSSNVSFSTSNYTGVTLPPSSSLPIYATGDLNGDNFPDIAYPIQGTDTVAIYQNKSTTGSISYMLSKYCIVPSAMSFSNIWDGQDIQIRDLNYDKKPDITLLASFNSSQYLIFLKNNSTATKASAIFNDTLELHQFEKAPYNYKENDTGVSMVGSYLDFSDFSFVNNDPCHIRPDILLSVEGAYQKYSVISYWANTSTLNKISFSAPCWFENFTSDRAGVGDFNGDGKDDLLSLCDVCIPSPPNSNIYGLSVLENISTFKIGNQGLGFDSVSVPCKANRTGGMKIKLYLPCHALTNLAKDSILIAWKPNISSSDTATLMYGMKYTVHVYSQSKKYDTTFTFQFANPYSIGANGVPIKVLFSDTTICPGAPILLSMEKSNKINHYSWTPNVAINNDTLFDPTVNPTVTTVYHVSGVGGQCLRDTFVKVNVHPLPIIMAKPDTIVCPGAPVMLYAYGAKLYAWSPTRHLSNDSGSITIAKVDSTTTFSVDGFDGRCHGLATAMITTIAAPTVFAGKRWTIHSNESYTINDASVTGSYFNYWWTPHLFMNDTTLLHPTVYNSESMWFVLHSVNAYGCSSADSVFIKFDPLGHIFVPTAFSPNNDGENDRLRIVKENIRTFHMVIFNRWGQTVFETDGLTKEWDGRYNGEPEPMGSYVYYVEATDIGGHPINMHGNITLLR